MTDYVRDHFTKFPGQRVRDCLDLRDGTRLSVQASSGHYCNPRDTDGPHSVVEVMVVKGRHPIELIRQSSYGRSEDGVYPFVSVKVVNAIIARKGGLAA